MESLNDSVVACKVDGVEATEENIENGTYTVQRPFIQIYKKGTDSALINAWFEFIELMNQISYVFQDSKLLKMLV